MDRVNLLGLAAGSLTTISFLPQVLKTWRSRSAGDISLGMYALFSLGLGLWLAYGLVIHALPIVVANAITLGLTLAIMLMKLRFARGG